MPFSCGKAGFRACLCPCITLVYDHPASTSSLSLAIGVCGSSSVPIVPIIASHRSPAEACRREGRHSASASSLPGDRPCYQNPAGLPVGAVRIESASELAAFCKSIKEHTVSHVKFLQSPLSSGVEPNTHMFCNHCSHNSGYLLAQ